MGSRPSSRHRQPASTTPRGIPTPRSRSALDVSHVLDGLLRQLPSRACFIPLPRPGFALQGFVPHRGAVPGFPGRFMPSWRWAHPPVTSECAPAFRALLPAASAVSSGRVQVPTDPRPSWASRSPGCSPRAAWECLHIPSAPGLRREEPLAADPRRIAAARIGLPGFRLPTRSSFLA